LVSPVAKIDSTPADGDLPIQKLDVSSRQDSHCSEVPAYSKQTSCESPANTPASNDLVSLESSTPAQTPPPLLTDNSEDTELDTPLSPHDTHTIDPSLVKLMMNSTMDEEDPEGDGQDIGILGKHDSLYPDNIARPLTPPADNLHDEFYSVPNDDGLPPPPLPSESCNLGIDDSFLDHASMDLFSLDDFHDRLDLSETSTKLDDSWLKSFDMTKDDELPGLFGD